MCGVTTVGREFLGGLAPKGPPRNDCDFWDGAVGENQNPARPKGSNSRTRDACAALVLCLLTALSVAHHDRDALEAKRLPDLIDNESLIALLNVRGGVAHGDEHGRLRLRLRNVIN